MYDTFKKLKAGDVFEMPSVLPGLDVVEKVAGTVTKAANPVWHVDLYWHGVFLMSARAEAKPSGMHFTTFGAA